MKKDPRYLYVQRETLFYHTDKEKIFEREKEIQAKVAKAVTLLLELGYEINIKDEGAGVCIYYADPTLDECFIYDDGQEEEDCE